MTIPIAIFGLGVLAFVLSLPVVALAFVFNCYWIFVVGTLAGAAGLFCIGFGVFLKLASLLFRA